MPVTCLSRALAKRGESVENGAVKGIALILVGVLSVGALAGCGGTRERAKPTEIQPPATVPPAIPRCAEGESVLLGGANESLFAVVRRPTRAFRTPDDGGLIARFGVRNVNGHLTVFSVLGAVVDARCRPVWLGVELPLRPNGETGFVPAKDVNLGTVDTKIVVDLSRRLVTLYRAGKPALRARAAVGAPCDADPDRPFLRQPAAHRTRIRTARTARPRSGSRPSRTCSPAGRREARSRSTGRTSRGRSGRRSRTAAFGSKTRFSSDCSAAVAGGTPVVIRR